MTLLIVPAATDIAGQCRIVCRAGRVDNALAAYRSNPDFWFEVGLMTSRGKLACLDAAPSISSEIKDCEPLMAGTVFHFDSLHPAPTSHVAPVADTKALPTNKSAPSSGHAQQTLDLFADNGAPTAAPVITPTARGPSNGEKGAKGAKGVNSFAPVSILKVLIRAEGEGVESFEQRARMAHPSPYLTPGDPGVTGTCILGERGLISHSRFAASSTMAIIARYSDDHAELDEMPYDRAELIDAITQVAGITSIEQAVPERERCLLNLNSSQPARTARTP